MLEDDWIGCGRGGAPDCRAPARRLQPAGGISGANVAAGSPGPGQRKCQPRTAGGRAAFAGSHAGTGSHAAVCRSAAAEGGLSGRPTRCTGRANRPTESGTARDADCAGGSRETRKIIRRKTCHAAYSKHPPYNKYTRKGIQLSAQADPPKETPYWIKTN